MGGNLPSLGGQARLGELQMAVWEQVDRAFFRFHLTGHCAIDRALPKQIERAPNLPERRPSTTKHTTNNENSEKNTSLNAQGQTLLAPKRSKFTPDARFSRLASGIRFAWHGTSFIARVAELADAADSKSADREVVGVRDPPWALVKSLGIIN